MTPTETVFRCPRRVFVSGGSGVIGRELVPRLLAHGAEVLVGDLKPRPAEFPAAVHYRHGDLNTLRADELAAFAPDAFIHLAATFERSSETRGFWDENFRHNLQLSHHLTGLATAQPTLERVVFASSYLIYETTLYQFAAPHAPVGLREEAPVLPRNLTGMAKLAHEIELRFLAGFADTGFSSVCARIFRGYGCGSRDVISRWVRAALRGEPVSVFRPEGCFDYVYAADAAEGLLRLAAMPAVTGIINLGTGRARRVQEVIDGLRALFPALQVVTADADIPFEASQADTTRLQAQLGWTPEYTLERALPEIVAWEQARLDASAPDTGQPPVVLLSSSAAKVPLLRALQAAARRLHPDARVIAGDLDPGVLTATLADDFWQLPETRPESLAALLDGCRARGITHVLPSRDGELAFWAAHAPHFAGIGVSVIVAPAEAVGLCTDKLAFARFGSARGLPVIPAGLTPVDLPGCTRFVVKTRHGAGSRAIGLDLDPEAAVLHAATLVEPLFQPWVPGPEISVDAWLDRRHRVKGLVLRRRDEVVNGESRITTTFRDPGLEHVATGLLEALGLTGPVVLQAKIDPDGRLAVIECNARFGGASTLGLQAGLDSLYWSLLEAQGADVGDCPFLRCDGELRQVRVPHDLHLPA